MSEERILKKIVRENLRANYRGCINNDNLVCVIGPGEYFLFSDLTLITREQADNLIETGENMATCFSLCEDKARVFGHFYFNGSTDIGFCDYSLFRFQSKWNIAGSIVTRDYFKKNFY